MEGRAWCTPQRITTCILGEVFTLDFLLFCSCCNGGLRLKIPLLACLLHIYNVMSTSGMGSVPSWFLLGLFLLRNWSLVDYAGLVSDFGSLH